MARIRSIHPGLFTDEAFMSLSAHGRLLLMGIWTEAWDDGVFEWKALTLKARIFPVDSVDVGALLAELAAAGCVRQEMHGDKAIGLIRNFQKFQRPKKPNKSGMLRDEWREYVGNGGTEETSTDDSSEPVRNQFRSGTEKPPQMEDGGGNSTPSGSNEPSGVSARELSARQVFETILTPERAKALTDSRNRKKAAQTAHAAELVVAKLRAFADPNAAADLMILKGWTSIEPDWGERNGLRLAATVIPMAGTAPGIWITDDDPRWPACAARWQREKGRRPSANGSRHNAGIGHSFPADWPETKSQAEAAA